LETIKQLRAGDRDLKIIAVSGALAGSPAGSPDSLSLAAKLWGIHTLHKPFRPSVLLQLINDTVSMPGGPTLQERGALA
jgi:hypothetical protein